MVVSTWFIKGTALTSTVVADRAHHQSRIHCRRAAAEHQDFGVRFGFEAVLRDRDSISSGGKIRDHERAVLGMGSHFEVGRDVDGFHSGVGHNSSRRISHRAGDSTQRLLGGGELRQKSKRQNGQSKGRARTSRKARAHRCQRDARDNLL